MISRVAECCFWLTRYLERVDTWARMLGVNTTFTLDVTLPETERWHSLLIVVGGEEDFAKRIGIEKREDPEAVQRYLVWDPENPCSLVSTFRSARENARTVREVMSVEMWESINDTWIWLKSRPARRLYERDRDGFYDRLTAQCMLFHGICYSTMLHGEPFVFMKLGRAVERAGQTARILDVQHHSIGAPAASDAIEELDDLEIESAAASAQWLAILRSLCASEPFFHRAENARLSGPEVVRFLIFDASFPRSVLHNLDRTRGLLARLREDDPRHLDRESWRKLETLRGTLLQMDNDDIHRIGLHRVLTWIVDATADLCNAIHRDYLDPPLQMARPSPFHGPRLVSQQGQSR